MSEQLKALTEPFPSSVVQNKPGGFAAAYVDHGTVTRRLLDVVGPFDTKLVDTIFDGDMVTGVVLRMTLTIDGVEHAVEEIGDVENAKSKGSNGARMKDAVSDALKRCAMRFGVGLELWAKSETSAKPASGEQFIEPKRATQRAPKDPNALATDKQLGLLRMKANALTREQQHALVDWIAENGMGSIKDKTVTMVQVDPILQRIEQLAETM